MKFLFIFEALKNAATKIPWINIMKHAPIVVDTFGKAKDVLGSSSKSAQEGLPSSIIADKVSCIESEINSIKEDIERKYQFLRDENINMSNNIVDTSNQLQDTVKSLKIIASRQLLLTYVTGLTLLLVIISLAFIFAKLI